MGGGETSSSLRGEHPQPNKNEPLPFVNQNGRDEGIQAGRDLRRSLGSLKQEEPQSPVKCIADKIKAIPPALQVITHAKDHNAKERATVDLELRMGAVQSAVDSFLEQRRADMEHQQEALTRKHTEEQASV